MWLWKLCTFSYIFVWCFEFEKLALVKCQHKTMFESKNHKQWLVWYEAKSVRDRFYFLYFYI